MKFFGVFVLDKQLEYKALFSKIEKCKSYVHDLVQSQQTLTVVKEQDEYIEYRLSGIKNEVSRGYLWNSIISVNTSTTVYITPIDIDIHNIEIQNAVPKYNLRKSKRESVPISINQNSESIKIHEKSPIVSPFFNPQKISTRDQIHNEMFKKLHKRYPHLFDDNTKVKVDNTM